jgi:hypothetical protein
VAVAGAAAPASSEPARSPSRLVAGLGHIRRQHRHPRRPVGEAPSVRRIARPRHRRAVRAAGRPSAAPPARPRRPESSAARPHLGPARMVAYRPIPAPRRTEVAISTSAAPIVQVTRRPPLPARRRARRIVEQVGNRGRQVGSSMRGL